ncbi:MAG: hypothetical protein AB7T37_12710 [Dehalococcoidia bacterium]
MSARAFFGPPAKTAAPGGLQVSVYIVPVYQGRLVAFDIHAKAVSGRWLPWAVIDYRQNPYEAAALLADDWLDVGLDDLRVVDVLSAEGPLRGWELAIVYRAELSELPKGDSDRAPYLYPADGYDAIAIFEPTDFERWVGAVGTQSNAPATSTAPGDVKVF